MREILFRGIPKDDTNRHFFMDIWKDNCNGSFVYGSLIIHKGRYYICVSAMCSINSNINNGITSMIEVIPETIGQYTGLTDKNGKKIFEWDIVNVNTNPKDSLCHRYEGKNLVIRFDEYHRFIASGRLEYPLCNHYEWEVIGNIHDNPELLKGGEG